MATKKTSKPVDHSSCTILRTIKITSLSLDWSTGKTTEAGTRIETRACESPLFDGIHLQHGVCKSCAKGWESTGNVFANEAERDRAAALREVYGLPPDAVPFETR